MIRLYTYHSMGFGCMVTLAYDDGFLKSVEIEAPVDTGRPDVKVFNKESDFVAVCRKHNTPFTEVKRDVTFEMFWERYNYKASGRIPAQKAWDKLTEAERISAYDYIPTYEAHLKMSRTAKKYASTYLNSKIYIR